MTDEEKINEGEARGWFYSAPYSEIEVDAGDIIVAGVGAGTMLGVVARPPAGPPVIRWITGSHTPFVGWDRLSGLQVFHRAGRPEAEAVAAKRRAAAPGPTPDPMCSTCGAEWGEGCWCAGGDILGR